MDKELQKRKPGRPRLNEIGNCSLIQLRLPKQLRENLIKLLDKKNESLIYHLSMNSFLLKLIEVALLVEDKVEQSQVLPKETTVEDIYSEEHSRHILMTTPSSLKR